MNSKTQEESEITSLEEKSNCDQSDLFMDLWEWTQAKIGSGIRIVKDMGNILDLRFLSNGSVNEVGLFLLLTYTTLRTNSADVKLMFFWFYPRK